MTDSNKELEFHMGEITVNQLITFLNTECAKSMRKGDFEKSVKIAEISAKVQEGLLLFHEKVI